MKKVFQALTALCLTVCISSCTRTLYTADEILSRYTTKDGVIGYYGLPTVKRQDGKYTEFYYDHGTGSVGSAYASGSARGSVTRTQNGAYGEVSGNGYAVGSVVNFNRYVKFTFDENDRVINAEARGVDLSVKQKAPGKTALFIIMLVGGSIAAGAALAGSM